MFVLLLSNTFFENARRVDPYRRENSHFSLDVSPARLALIGNNNTSRGWLDTFLKMIASHEHEEFLTLSASEKQVSLMRAWLAGIILAIFGLWLATI